MKQEDVKVDGKYHDSDGLVEIVVLAIVEGAVMYKWGVPGMNYGASTLAYFADNMTPLRVVPNLGWHLPEWATGIKKGKDNYWYMITKEEGWLTIPKDSCPQIDVAPADSWFTREELEAEMKEVRP